MSAGRTAMPKPWSFFLTGLVDSARCVKTSKLGSTCSISTTTSVSGATRNERVRRQGDLASHTRSDVSLALNYPMQCPLRCQYNRYDQLHVRLAVDAPPLDATSNHS